MSTHCAGCGAPLPDSGACVEYFHELLVLEAEVPGAAGAEPHFLAVAAYNLQHPSGFMPDALLGLQRMLADVLAGRATMDDARRRARAAADGATRVRRGATDELSDQERAMLQDWPTEWPLTALDVCRVPPESYVARVREWADAVALTLAQMRPS